jgi:mono/diheme cytochrome c family protein
MPLILTAFLSSSCGNHDPQPTLKAWEGPRVPPAGAIARTGYSYVLGRNGYPENLIVDEKFIAEGKINFEHRCSACHGFSGRGNGIAAARGLSNVPSFHTDEARGFSPEDLFMVMSDGLGRMPSYARRLSPEDRWKTAAYIKALQLSGSISEKALDPSDREKLP